jgi:hypothetical protein
MHRLSSLRSSCWSVMLFKVETLAGCEATWGASSERRCSPVWTLPDYFKAFSPASTFSGSAGKCLIRTPVAL